MARQIETSQQTQRTGHSAIRAQFPLEDDVLITEMKEKNLGWDVIENN